MKLEHIKEHFESMKRKEEYYRIELTRLFGDSKCPICDNELKIEQYPFNCDWYNPDGTIYDSFVAYCTTNKYQCGKIEFRRQDGDNWKILYASKSWLKKENKGPSFKSDIEVLNRRGLKRGY